jgi:hypothetical protein
VLATSITSRLFQVICYWSIEGWRIQNTHQHHNRFSQQN